MTDEDYRDFWNKLLERYPEYNPTMQQTKDWRSEFQHKDVHIVEAAVATVVSEYSSSIPKIPWFVKAFFKVVKKRAREASEIRTEALHTQKDIDYEEILKERKAHTEQLQAVDLDSLRSACRVVLDKYSKVLKAPKDADVKSWDRNFRACVWVELFGND
jgi:trans-2-enoyl-CoA reductase|tara:strand:+ start:28 stop:504 length:477 start_codon:yes stop_codon:yes gene_type:complete